MRRFCTLSPVSHLIVPVYVLGRRAQPVHVHSRRFERTTGLVGFKVTRTPNSLWQHLHALCSRGHRVILDVGRDPLVTFQNRLGFSRFDVWRVLRLSGRQALFGPPGGRAWRCWLGSRTGWTPCTTPCLLTTIPLPHPGW